MKISWGVGITITILIFLLVSFATIYFSFSQEVNLVRDDYYEQEVKFQNQIDIIEKTKELPEQLEIKIVGEDILFRFPSIFKDKLIEGNIFLYRPSNRDNDINIKIDLDENLLQYFSTKKLLLGMWKIQVNWQVENNNYFNEKIIMVN